jgi:transcription termination/antitermination protein NusG
MTNDIPTLPPSSPDAVSPPPAEVAPPVAIPAAPPAPTEEASLAATGEGVAASAGETPPPEPPAEAPAEPAPEEPKPPELPPSNKHWYVVKVQSGREESIKEAVERRVKIEGLEEFYGQIVIPVEKVVEMRNSKRVTRERKLFPGYLMAEVEYNDRILYLFRETSGVGDFVGASVTRAPTPMTPREVERMIRKTPGAPGAEEIKEVQGKAPVDRGDRVKVKDGTFAGMEGEVKDIIEAKSQVRVELVIFGRPVPVDLEYWQVEPV